jgi:hypothetical protein
MQFFRRKNRIQNDAAAGATAEPQIPASQRYATVAFLEYLNAATWGSPANLERYCDPTLLQWYDKQNVTVQEAKAQMAEFDRNWPRQHTEWRFNQMGVTRMTYPGQSTPSDDYYFTIPFIWTGTNNQRSTKTVDGILCTVVVKLADGKHWRIAAAYKDGQ